MPAEDAKYCVDEICELIRDMTSLYGKLVITGFGTFKKVTKKGKVYKDVHSGNLVQASDRTTLTFSPSGKCLEEFLK